MVLLKLGWREIKHRPGRSLLTLLSIVIGVATVVAVTLTAKSSQLAFDELFRTVTGRAALEVTSAGGGSFDESVVKTIGEVSGVETAVPMIQMSTIMWYQEQRTKLLALGIDPVRDKAVRDYTIIEGKSFADTEGKGILLDATFAKSLGVKPGSHIKFLTRRGKKSGTIAGLFSPTGTASTGQGAVMLLPIGGAQSVSRLKGKVHRVQIVLAPGADEAAVEASIAKQLPVGLKVGRPMARSALAKETTLSTQNAMNMSRAFALLVATFIIANTFLIGVTQRRRQIGIMRAIGATRHQISAMLYIEAMLFGLLGTLFGWLAGVVGAYYLNHAMGALYETSLPPISLNWTSIWIALGFGLGISLLGAYLPTRKACRLSPVEAIRDVLPDEIEGVSKWLIILGALLVVIGGSVLAGCILGHVDIVHSVWSGVVLLVGLVFLLPSVVGTLSSVVATTLNPFFRVEARLARRQLIRHRARTTLTIGVLFVAISTGIGLTNSIVDNVNDVKDWYRKTIVADFFVRAMTPDMATGLAADLPDGVGEKIRMITGITDIETIRFVNVAVGEENRAIVVVRDFTAHDEPELDLVRGDAKGLRDRLHQGDVVVGSVLAERMGLHVGDRVSIDAENGPQELLIAAIANDYFAGGLTIFMQREVAERLLNVSGVDAYVVNADHAQLDSVRQQLQTLVDEEGLILQSFSDIQQRIDHMMAGVVAGLWALAFLGAAAAIFGVANTLTMNVLEQTREIGLLRIIAATRWQIRKTIFVQALMIGLMGLVPGTIAGVGLAWLISLSTLPTIGHPVAFVIHPWLIIGAVLSGLLLVVVAGLYPAERAARMELLDAIKLR